MPDVKGGRRQEKARETRRRIVAAAHELFAEQGFTSTTIQQIAGRAGVAWQTVYAVFKTKVAILSEVFDVAVAGDDEPVAVMRRPFVQRIAEAAAPADKAAIFAAHLRETATRTAGVVSVIESAAASDPEIAALWRTLQGQRASGMAAAARALAGQGVLRPGLSVEQAADILFFYTGPWAYRALVAERGWSGDDYETWLARTLHEQVLAP